jgi:alpha-L-rhamnosidase
MKQLTITFLLLTLICFKNEAQINRSLDTTIRFQISLNKPLAIQKTGENHYFIDFGKDAFGTLVLKLKVTQKDTLVVHLGEKIITQNQIDRKPGGTIRYKRILVPVDPSIMEYTVQLPADKRNTTGAAYLLPKEFGVIMPFRYCELENYTSDLAANSIRQKAYNYQFNDTASYFTSSDSTLNKIWDLCKYSIKATSFCGIYVDGDRERIPYEADALINQLSHYSVDHDYALARKTNEYFINHPTWPTEWSLHTVLLFYYDFLYTGNSTSLLKNWDALKVKTLMELELENGLISTKSPLLNDDLMKRLGFQNNKQRLKDIVDWPSPGERDGFEMKNVNTVVNAFYYFDLKLMAELAGYLAKKADAEMFLKKSVQVRNTINEKLIDKAKGIYVDGENSTHSSIHANLFPLAFDMVPAEHIQTVKDFIKSRGMACSVYGAQFLLEGLYKANEPNWAFNLMTANTDRSWMNMIRSGSTIAMEAWDIKYKSNTDWNHAWGAAPANIITRYMWGIKPVSPGFEKAEIDPQLDPLTSSTIKVPTRLGPINASFKIFTNGTKRYTIEVPATMIVDFKIKSDGILFLAFNNKIINSKTNTIRLKQGMNLIEIKK